MSERKGRGGRPLTAEDHLLWSGVARSVAPLRKSAPAPSGEGGSSSPKRAKPAPRLTGAASDVPPYAPKAPAAPALAQLDRRTRQRIARGATKIDGRLDLHGMTQEEAHAALRRFLRAAQSRGGRTVLVITGKGTLTGRGVLKRQVPHWLALPELRDIVLGFEDAAIPHGGEGALYVRIRRKRADAG